MRLGTHHAGLRHTLTSFFVSIVVAGSASTVRTESQVNTWLEVVITLKNLSVIISDDVRLLPDPQHFSSSYIAFVRPLSASLALLVPRDL